MNDVLAKGCTIHVGTTKVTKYGPEPDLLWNPVTVIDDARSKVNIIPAVIFVVLVVVIPVLLLVAVIANVVPEISATRFEIVPACADPPVYV